jgi:protein-tyrosine sulfotransferase
MVHKVRNRLTRIRRRRWRNKSWHSTERHIVVGGSPRSGTTLIRRTLDRHPSICCGPESSIFLPGAILIGPVAAGFKLPADELRRMLDVSPSQGAFIDTFATRYRQSRGRARWAEKTPLNVRHIDWILERFPESRFVHVVRDGRDVVCSMREHPERRWVDGAWVTEASPLSLEEHAQRWVTDTEAGIAHRGDPRYLEVRYEDLVQDPEGVVRRLIEGLGEAFHPELLLDPAKSGKVHANAPIRTRSMGRWHTDLTPEEQAVVQRIAGATLARLGYPSD